MERTPSGLRPDLARPVLAVATALVLVVGLAALFTRPDTPATGIATTRATTATTMTADEPVAPPQSSPGTTAAVQAANGAEEAGAAPAPEPEPVPGDPATTAPDAAPADHAALLRNRTFESVSVVEGGSGERTFADDGAVTVRFEGSDDGDVVGWRISCNAAGGPVTVSADQLTVEEITSSAMGCGPEREAEDSWIASFFHSSPGWALDGSRLTLWSGDTVIVLDDVTSA